VKPEILDSCLTARLTNPTPAKRVAVLAIAKYIAVSFRKLLI
jgi:hypothetical protein